MKDKKEIVHYPDCLVHRNNSVTIYGTLCGGDFDFKSKGIYSFSFDVNKVTCQECLERIKE